MNKLFKDESYLVSAFRENAEITLGSDVIGFMKNAALKKGFQILRIGAYKEVGEFGLGENVTFDAMQDVMKTVSRVTGLSLFISNKTDIVGTNLYTDPAAQRVDAFLKTRP